MTSPARRLRPFTPTAEDASALDERTVGRDAILQLVSDRLGSAAVSGNRAHTLIVGPRGSGKSHVIGVALHRLAQQPELASRFAVVTIDEDAVGVTRVADLLADVSRSLGVPAIADNADMRQAISTALDGRVLVLVLHNLDRIFEAIGVSGQQELRAWVETSGEAMLLATSPALFAGVRNRDRPWYNNFAVSHLDDLTLEQGRDLLGRLALAYGDEALAGFIASDDGEARLKAVHALAGGSPRVWMILSECLTVEVLDDLVAAVEGLLEGLVPYYQQLLWELSGNEQRLVRALADGTTAAMTVSQLATAAGLEQRTAASTLGRLADMRWVNPEKAPGLDRRTTYYRLGEPMLRHHLQYRAAARQPLPLIVELLRAAFDTTCLQRELFLAVAGSMTERVLARSLSEQSQIFEHSWSGCNPVVLLVEARRWISGEDGDRRTPGAGVAAEAAVLVGLGDVHEARELEEVRSLGPSPGLVATLETTDAELPAALDPQARIGRLLDAAAETLADRDRQVLELVAVGWNREHRDWGELSDRLAALRRSVSSDTDPLALDIDLLWTRWAVVFDIDRSQLGGALERVGRRAVELRGESHPDTLSVRLASATRALMDEQFETSTELFGQLAADLEKFLGAEHSDTRFARYCEATSVGFAGHPKRARTMFESLLDVRDESGGPLRPADFEAQVAYWAGESSDPGRACEVSVGLLQRAGDLGADTRSYARMTLGRNLRRLARSSSLDDRSTPRLTDEFRVLSDLQDAFAGSNEARARLPGELISVLDELQKESQG